MCLLSQSANGNSGQMCKSEKSCIRWVSVLGVFIMAIQFCWFTRCCYLHFDLVLNRCVVCESFIPSKWSHEQQFSHKQNLKTTKNNFYIFELVPFIRSFSNSYKLLKNGWNSRRIHCAGHVLDGHAKLARWTSIRMHVHQREKVDIRYYAGKTLSFQVPQPRETAELAFLATLRHFVTRYVHFNGLLCGTWWCTDCKRYCVALG